MSRVAAAASLRGIIRPMSERATELLSLMRSYSAARRELLQAIGCNSSNRDPLAEFSEYLMAALLDGELAQSRVQAHYDLTDPSGRGVQVKYLANPSAGWVNEHTVHFGEGVDDYALVFFEDLLPLAAIVFPRATLGAVCRDLGKRHPRQDELLQLTRRNFQHIRSKREAMALHGVRLFEFDQT
jgi:hypothetical protein